MADNLRHLAHRDGECVDGKIAAHVKDADFNFLTLSLEDGECRVLSSASFDGLSLRCRSGRDYVRFSHV